MQPEPPDQSTDQSTDDTTTTLPPPRVDRLALIFAMVTVVFLTGGALYLLYHVLWWLLR